MFPRCGPDVAGDANPFMEYRPQQVECAELLDDAIADFLAFDLFGEGAEHPVPDDEHPGIVAIQVARIGGVVDAVMARRVHDEFEPARKFVDGLGVNPELVDQVDRADKQDHRRMESDKDQG